MDVPNAAFPQELIKIIQQIVESRFVAIDLEFSGVAGRRPAGGSGKLALQDYYEDLRSAAQIYQILQIGVTIVSEDTEKGRYAVQPYNFHLSPLPATKEQVFRRVWSYNSGAISFLMRNGFSVDRPLTQGVHYLSRQEEQQVRQKLIEDDKARSNLPDMILKEDDSALVDHIKLLVNDWQSLPKEQQTQYLNIPAEDAKDHIPSVLNRYQVRLTHQTVRNEYPKLKTQGMGHFVQITNPTADQQANEKEMREQAREREIQNAIGFRWIIEAILGGDLSKMPHYYVQAAFPDGKAPKDIQHFLDTLQRKAQSRIGALVGHNCFTDLVNFYRCFIGDLPERVEDFGARLHELFPIVLDTKFIAGIGNKRWADTSLKAVEDDIGSQELPHLYLPPKFDDYLDTPNYHEAGFDSYVTAKIALKLLGKVKREGKYVKSLAGAPELPVDQTPVNPALEQGDQIKETSIADPESSGQGLVKSVTEVIKAPVAAVKSILIGSDSTAQGESNSRGGNTTMSTTAQPTDTAVVTKDAQQQKPVPKSGPQQVKGMSTKSNIFDMLDDEPVEVSEEDGVAQDLAKEQQRVAEMVQKGLLIPGWSEDVEFWRSVSNKLQANACLEGILDFSPPSET
jgi:poly(A)-specific ribonuclease